MSRRVLDRILPQVRLNCLISDAGYWGYYSTCGLLLRLREQYRFEEGVPPGEPVDIKKVGPWIEKREADWQRLESEALRDIVIGKGGNDTYGPFDAEAINTAIEGKGLVYGGGYGVYMKPVFFLAELESRRSLGPYTVVTAGRELARDLSIHPAMSRGKTIIARTDMSRAMLRDRFEEYRASKRQGALARAFEGYDIGPDADEMALRELADSELETFIRHEYGELKESERLGPDWSGMLSALGKSRAGLHLRGIKDALADTSEGGTLSHIIEKQKPGSLHFLVASLTGLRHSLLFEVRQASDNSNGTPDWDSLESARRDSYISACEMAEKALDIYRATREAELEVALGAILRCPVPPPAEAGEN